MAVDAVRECCISLLRQDKARQAKTGQDCLFVSRLLLDPSNSRGAKTEPTIPTSSYLERVARRCQRKGDSKGVQEQRREERRIVKAQAEQVARMRRDQEENIVRCVWKGKMKLEETLSRDNETAHECRNEWMLFSIANSDPSGLPDLHLARRLIHATSQPPP